MLNVLLTRDMYSMPRNANENMILHQCKYPLYFKWWMQKYILKIQNQIKIHSKVCTVLLLFNINDLMQKWTYYRNIPNFKDNRWGRKVTMEDSKIDMIFAGNFDRLERVKHPIIRVYLSSTYTDMTMEKSILVTEVYPKVKEYCRERYGAEFQVGFSDPHLQFVNKDEWMNYLWL